MRDNLLSAQNQLGPIAKIDNLPVSNELEKALCGYLLSCKVEGKTPKTLEIYDLAITRFVRFAQDNHLPLNPAEISAGDVRLYLLHCYERGLKPSSVHAYYRSLRTFFNWLESEELIKASPMKNIKPPRLPKQLVKPFSRKDIDKLLFYCSGRRFVDLRNRAILLLFIDTGLRLSELANIQLEDINMGQELIKVMGKGSKERVVRFGKVAQKAMVRYLLERRDDYSCLWVTASRKPMSKFSIQTMVGRLCRMAGVVDAKPGPHTFRHTCAINFLRNGGDSCVLQYMLGHSTLEMTRRYLSSLGQEELIRVHKQASPVDRMGL